jgi:PAS domain S-box-containing protein
MHIRANSAYLEMFGFDSFDDVEGMSLLDLVAPRHVADFKQLLKRLSKGETPPPSYELGARDMDGEEFPAVMEFTQASYEGEPCVQVVFRKQELAQDPELAQKLRELQERDPATGLLNRQTFLRTLEDAVSDAGKNQARHGLLLVEPDHYQRLLHDMGLDAADAVLAAMAERLRGALGEDAVAARFGEHSLAVLLRGGDHVSTPAALAFFSPTSTPPMLAVRLIDCLPISKMRSPKALRSVSANWRVASALRPASSTSVLPRPTVSSTCLKSSGSTSSSDWSWVPFAACATACSISPSMWLRL